MLIQFQEYGNLRCEFCAACDWPGLLTVPHSNAVSAINQACIPRFIQEGARDPFPSPAHSCTSFSLHAATNPSESSLPC